VFESLLAISEYDLTTSSRVRTWYMVRFKGYTILQRREVPRVTRTGRLTYDYLWDLRPPAGSEVRTTGEDA
jgi:hypothetical protein